jgi:outer membrane protein assembly factor BamE (lipoprotein component of BamABCDE complex)
MKRSVQVARGLADWDQPDSTREKSFSVGDTVVMGQSKSQVVGKLGQPDAKRVFDGREVWEYRDVQFAASNPQTLTIYLTFDGDIVASSAGN